MNKIDKKLHFLLGKVKEECTKVKELSDYELKNKTLEFKERLKNGETTDDLLPEAFAVCCEADYRVLGMFPYDVQILGGIALHLCYLCEMNTGEGKTLTATMPLYLNGLTGKSTILVTENEYLAIRDAEEMGQVYKFLGLSVKSGVKRDTNEKLDNDSKKDVYDADIVYTTHGSLGFDYLLNNLVHSKEDRFMRDFYYVIIDEAAKATTPELLVSIIKAKKIILVGDQNQLPAYADQSISPKIAKLTKNPEYRMFDILFETLPNSHKQVLSTQDRMIRNIGNLISTVFYGGTIDTGCKDEDKLHGLSRYEGNSIIWFDTSENRRRKQKKTKGNSFMNEEEKRIILDILEDLKKSNELDNQDIGIITGYSGQKDILRNSVKAIGYDKIAQIDINVLDAFQGRENDIIMYSTVRTDNSIGFQKEKERVNVAFSRAKKLLIICGDLNFFYNYNDPNNKFIEIIDYIRTHDHCKIISCKGENLF